MCYQCDTPYQIPVPSGKDERELAIRYAKCPDCNTPRDHVQFNKKEVMYTEEKIKVLGECDICGANVQNKKYNLCRNCYSKMWKKNTDYNRTYMKKWREANKNHYK